MPYYTIQPPPELAEAVRFFWVFEHDIPGDSYVYRSMAEGCAELIFHYKGTFRELGEEPHPVSSTALLHAQSRRYRRFVTHDDFGIFGVYLYPFAVPRLFSCPAPELSNQMIDLKELLGGAGQLLEEQMMLATSNGQRVQLISHFLNCQLRRSQPLIAIQAAVRHIIQLKGKLTVDRLADQFCLSTRQFERNFKEYAGFSPKLFTRITRFHAALDHYGSPDKSLTQIAHECGYYDQSHFIHDFNEFSGYSPRQYFWGQAEGIEYRED